MQTSRPARALCLTLASFAATIAQAAPPPDASANLEAMHFEEVLMLADTGDKAAMHHACYGFMYGEHGASKDEAAAFHWCGQARKSGNTSATTLLAEIHYSGSEQRRDVRRARELYLEAARGGHPHAMYVMSQILFSEGDDMQMGLAWLNRAVDAGDPDAIAALEELKQALARELKRALKEEEAKGK